MSSEKKIYFILGASSDIGMTYIEHILESVDEDDITIIAHYRSMNARLQEITRKGKSVSIELLQADLSSHKELLEMLSYIHDKYNTPTHILCLAATPYRYIRVKEYEYERLKNDMEVQLYSVAETMKFFLPSMEAQHYGKMVVMLSSCTIGEPPKFLPEYVATKYALLGLVKSAAMEYADTGVCIYGFSPSMVETKFLKNIGRKIRETSAENSPLHRNLIPEDLIPTLDLLLDNDERKMNGINIEFNAGRK